MKLMDATEEGQKNAEHFAVLTPLPDRNDRVRWRLESVGGRLRPGSGEMLPAIAELSRVLEVEEDPPVLLLDAFDGTPLPVLLENLALEQEFAMRILRGAATALDEMHRQNFVHGAVRPDSFLVGRDGQVRLVDWALEWPVRSVDQVRALAPWAAPEVLLGERCTPPTDQFALGVIAFRLLYGQMPFTASRPAEALLGRLTGIWQSELISDVAESDLFDTVFAPEPSHRFASCISFVDALGRAFANASAAASTTVLMEAAPVAHPSVTPAKKRWNGPVFLVSCGCAALAFVLGAWNWNTARTLDRLNALNGASSAANGQSFRGGRMRLCNPSQHAVAITDLAVAYRNPQRGLEVFKAPPGPSPRWTIAPNSEQSLSSLAESGAQNQWDGSVLFYFLHVEQDGKEYLLSGVWDNDAPEGCLKVAAE